MYTRIAMLMGPRSGPRGIHLRSTTKGFIPKAPPPDSTLHQRHFTHSHQREKTHNSENAVLQFILEHPKATPTTSPTTIARSTHTSDTTPCQPQTKPTSTIKPPTRPLTRPESQCARHAHWISSTPTAGPRRPSGRIATSTDPIRTY